MSNSAVIFKVVVVGQGYVGLPVAMAAVDAGYSVVGVDLDSRRVATLIAGQSPVEDVSPLTLRKAIDSGRYVPTATYDEIAGFDVAIICVPTPLNEGRPDLGFIESAAASVAQYLTNGSIVILESTTYPGTTEELVLPLIESHSGLKAGRHFSLGYSPERIDPGNGQWNLTNTPKVVSGIDRASLQVIADFYSSLGIQVVRVRGTREAEMSKLLENTFRHVNVALVNELTKFAQALDVDIWDAIEASATKPFGFMKFTPGPGVGGHCLPVDPSYLSWAIDRKTGQSFKFVELANEVNRSMPLFVVNRIEAILLARKIDITASKILLMGLAYKANTGDIRESPALAVCELLMGRGAKVFAIDDFVHETHWPVGVGRIEAVSISGDFHVAVVLTDHRDMPYQWVTDNVPQVLDTRNAISGQNVEAL